MRRAPLLLSVLAAAAGLGLAVLPADAADQSVSANSSNRFAPADVTITQGDTVTWNNTGGTHNVTFDDGSFDMPPDAVDSRWTVQRTFNTPGTFSYVCERHAGIGMVGTVTVLASGQTGSGTGTDTTPQPPPPGGTTTGGDTTPGGSPPGSDSTRPLITGFSVTTARFRVGKGPTARDAAKRAKRGSAFKFRLSEQATLRIAISQVVRKRGKTRYVAKGTLIRRSLKGGQHKLSFSGRIGRHALAAGLYRATASATDKAGNKSLSRRAAFRVVR